MDAAAVGGLSSRLIAAVARREGIPVQAVTYGSRGWPDVAYAEAVARRLDIPWRRIELGTDYLSRLLLGVGGLVRQLVALPRDVPVPARHGTGDAGGTDHDRVHRRPAGRCADRGDNDRRAVARVADCSASGARSHATRSASCSARPPRTRRSRRSTPISKSRGRQRRGLITSACGGVPAQPRRPVLHVSTRDV